MKYPEEVGQELKEKGEIETQSEEEKVKELPETNEKEAKADESESLGIKVAHTRSSVDIFFLIGNLRTLESIDGMMDMPVNGEKSEVTKFD